MNFNVSFKLNQNIYLKDPESTDLGKQIVKQGIDLIYSIGFENFTFKKLAIEMQTTEASIYRYFENKHKLLLYIFNWYWNYVSFLLEYKLQNVEDAHKKLQVFIDLLSSELPQLDGQFEYNKKFLNHIIIHESSKVYLIKDIHEFNKDDVFRPYKELCKCISEIILECNPNYKFPHSLSSTLIETAHHQQFFASHLPSLTDVSNIAPDQYVKLFLNNLIESVIYKN
jgi:AcrR family transcriptional regulator